MAFNISADTPNMCFSDSDFCLALNRVKGRLRMLHHFAAQNDDSQLKVKFFLAGKYENTGFTGMRISGFEADAKIVHVEIAVPNSITYSDYAEDYIIAELDDALEAVNYFLGEMRMGFDYFSHKRLLDSLSPADKEEALLISA